MERYNFTNPLFLLKIESMIHRFYLIFCLLFLVACDDGDIITVDLDFQGELNLCEDFDDSYVVFDTREDPNEALILIFDKNEVSDAYFNTEITEDNPVVLNIDMTSVRFIYRTYNRTLTQNDFCSVIPPSDLVILEDYEAQSGTVQITTTVIDDDNDGIPSINEDLNGNGNLEDDDFDNDGIPNYLDQDDDGDNVDTIDEDDDEDGDGNPFTNPRNTDGTDEVDYLDTDDDNDGILTRLEDQNENQNPLDDFVISEGVSVLRYLLDDPIAMEAFPDPGTADNVYTSTVTTNFLIFNAGLEIINSTIIDFGNYTSDPESIVTEIE